jgi:hypothetical protein
MAVERSRWPAVVEIIVALVLFATASYLLFKDLGAASFHDGDESLYASVAREMSERNSFLTPTYWGEPFLHKPPLPYWLMSISAATLPGSREFDARFPSALSALLLLGLVYATARQLSGATGAILATGMLAFNHQFLFEHAARSANFDALLTFLMFSALIAGLKAAGGFAWRLIAVVMLGAVALVKAPMVIFPAATIIAHHWMRDRRFPAGLFWKGLGGVALVALPWHIHQWLVHGREFWDTYVMYEIIGRMGETVRDQASHRLIHLGATWQSFLPWSPLLVIALAGTMARRPRHTPDTRDDMARTLGIYAAFILVFFCFVRATWPWYSIPAYPALAVVAAVFVRHCYHSRWQRAVVAGLVTLMCVWMLAAGTNSEYDPASRPSFLWPVREQFYVWRFLTGGPLAILATLATVVVAVVALLPGMRKFRWPAGVAVTAAVSLMLWSNLRAVMAVPRWHRSAISRLAAEIEEKGIERVYAVGFVHQERYGGRLEPLSSYYLLGIRNAEVTDCRDDPACVSDSETTRAALVVRDAPESLFARAAALAPRVETWILTSDRQFEKLASPDASAQP